MRLYEKNIEYLISEEVLFNKVADVYRLMLLRLWQKKYNIKYRKNTAVLEQWCFCKSCKSYQDSCNAFIRISNGG